jgi:acetyl esterase/lipase
MEKKRIFFSVLIAIAVFIYLKYQESELELGSFLLAQISKFIIHDVRPYDNKESLQFWRGGLDRVTSIFGKEADYNYSMVDIDPNVQVGIFYPNNNVQKSSKYPILLWFHGGGFVEGSVYADRKNCQRMSRFAWLLRINILLL